MTMKGQEEAEIPVYAANYVDGGLQPVPPPAVTTAVVATVVKPAPTTQATVDVIAPTNMQGGYQFNVDQGGRLLKVAVPAGGVTAGQRFAALILDEGNAVAGTSTGANPHGIPTRRWRDDLCDCCKLGCCHPLCCLSCWCTPCALGQGTFLLLCVVLLDTTMKKRRFIE